MTEQLITLPDLAVKVNRSIDTLHWLRQRGVFQTTTIKTGNQVRGKSYVDQVNVAKVEEFIRTRGKKLAPVAPIERKYTCSQCGKPNEYPGLCKQCYKERLELRTAGARS